MKCPSCQHDNPTEVKFCGECGARLTLTCPACGMSNAPAQKFCGECGALLASFGPETRPAGAQAQAAAERRQLTVMFCDLVGSTELSSRLDPEELRELMDAYRHACRAVIARYDGHVAQYLGDGIMVYFGWPQAHEEDAERALRAALELVDAVKSVPTTPVLAVRIGAATGAVVVGEGSAEDLLEDIHWIDPSSLEAFDHLVQLTQSSRILTLITLRPEFQPKWTGQSHVTLLTLNRLGKRHTTELVKQVGGEKAIPEELKASRRRI